MVKEKDIRRLIQEAKDALHKYELKRNEIINWIDSQRKDSIKRQLVKQGVLQRNLEDDFRDVLSIIVEEFPNFTGEEEDICRLIREARDALNEYKLKRNEIIDWIKSKREKVIKSQLRRQGVSQGNLEDAFQDVLCMIVEEFPKFRGETLESLMAWIKEGIVKTVAKKWKSSQKREIVESDLQVEDPDNPDYEPSLIDEFADDIVNSPDYEAFEFREIIKNILNELNEQERVAFILHDVDGFRINEVAQFLGCNIEAAKELIYSARRKFRNKLIFENLRIEVSSAREIKIHNDGWVDVKEIRVLVEVDGSIRWSQQVDIPANSEKGIPLDQGINPGSNLVVIVKMGRLEKRIERRIN